VPSSREARLVTRSLNPAPTFDHVPFLKRAMRELGIPPIVVNPPPA
jgi:hypothetical protein